MAKQVTHSSARTRPEKVGWGNFKGRAEDKREKDGKQAINDAFVEDRLDETELELNNT